MKANEQQNAEKELLSITSGDMFQPYRYTVGRHSSKFLLEIRDNKKFYGVKCPGCGRVYVPPRKVCGRCFVAMAEFVPVSDEGAIVCCTIVYFGFVDPETGVKRPVPYGTAFIKLDGADTTIPHFLDSADREKVKVGARVKAVFEEKRKGSIMDIKHFALV